STADKGLKQVLSHFKEVLKKAPDYKLYIAGTTPENLEKYDLDKNLLHSDSVVILGRVTKEEVITHLRDSFCVFYPQNVHPETFGRIYIEANCIGTPVLAHSFGSIKEVIDNQDQLINASNSEEVVNRILKWQKNGRPEVSCKKEFQLDNIMKHWKETLGLD
ncbi:MAG: glycosyltransferase, partial [Gammaproteobacteria bacterium]|nr:glycosyltransferase [Gammaproteobacteria bacterium]